MNSQEFSAPKEDGKFWNLGLVNRSCRETLGETTNQLPEYDDNSFIFEILVLKQQEIGRLLGDNDQPNFALIGQPGTAFLEK
jgi:hypothetical protein